MSDCLFDPPNPELETLCRATEAAEMAAKAAQALADRGNSLGDWAKIAEVVTGALLPVAAIVFVIFMIRPIREVIESRKFTIKIAGFELSAQEVSDKLREQVDQLAHRLAELEGGAGEKSDSNVANAPVSMETIVSPEPMPPAPPAPRRILWVDDRPTNNAFEVASLRAAGHDVRQVLSTAEALDIIDAAGCDVVLSDMGRPEGRDAGLDLLQRLRDDGSGIAFGFYTSRTSLKRNAEAIARLGVFVATSDFVDLLKAFQRLPSKDKT